MFIEENYYQGFLKLCLKNENMKVIPTKKELEDIGCQITAMCYFVDKNGMQYNPRVINPEVIDGELRKLFSQKEVCDSIPKSIDAATQEEKKPTVRDGFKVCEECETERVIEHFRRKPGRGFHYHNICSHCEAKQRTEDMTKLLTPSNTETKEVCIERETVQKSTHVNQCKRHLTLERAKELILEAYSLGFAEAQIEVIENITLNEILSEAV